MSYSSSRDFDQPITTVEQGPGWIQKRYANAQVRSFGAGTSMSYHEIKRRAHDDGLRSVLPVLSMMVGALGLLTSISVIIVLASPVAGAIWAVAAVITVGRIAQGFIRS